MLLPLRLNLAIPAQHVEEPRTFLKRRKPGKNGFAVSIRRDGPPELPHWAHPPIPPKPIRLKPEIVASRAELLARAAERAAQVSDDDMLLLLAA